MSWKDLVPFIIVILGIILFLYGANYYNAVTGWTGLFLIIVGIIAEIVLKIYVFFQTKKGGV